MPTRRCAWCARGANFAIHEFGHLAFLFFGECMTIAGGSIMQLDLVTMGEAADESDVTGHDWQYLLMKTHLLQQDLQLAALCRFVAGLVLVASVLFGAWLLWRMATAPGEPAPASS